jgi:hypothetical protein
MRNKTFWDSNEKMGLDISGLTVFCRVYRKGPKDFKYRESFLYYSSNKHHYTPNIFHIR